MRHIHDDEFRDSLGMEERGAPGNRSAPIVTGKEDFLLPELIGNGNHMGDQLHQRIGSDAARFAAQVVAALVGHDDAKARSSQRLDLFSPPIPKFREAVQEQDNSPTLRSCGNSVQLYAAILKEDFLKGGWHSTRVYTRERDSPRQLAPTSP